MNSMNSEKSPLNKGPYLISLIVLIFSKDHHILHLIGESAQVIFLSSDLSLFFSALSTADGNFLNWKSFDWNFKFSSQSEVHSKLQFKMNHKLWIISLDRMIISRLLIKRPHNSLTQVNRLSDRNDHCKVLIQIFWTADMNLKLVWAQFSFLPCRCSSLVSQKNFLSLVKTTSCDKNLEWSAISLTQSENFETGLGLD